MSSTALAPLERALHTTNIWLKEVTEELGWEDRDRAYRALRTVLHALRDRLTLAEVADLGAQLPLLVRGLYYEGWNPNRTPSVDRTKEAFLAEVASAFADDPDTFPEGITWGVLRVLERHVSPGEIGDVKHVLSAEIRNLMP